LIARGEDIIKLRFNKAVSKHGSSCNTDVIYKSTIDYQMVQSLRYSMEFLDATLRRENLIDGEVLMRARDRMPRGRRCKKSCAHALARFLSHSRVFLSCQLAQTRHIFLPHPLSRSNLSIVGFRSPASLVNWFLSRSLMPCYRTNARSGSLSTV